MESMVKPIHSEYWRNKKVLITGHTGFKGCWLTLVLLNSGALVTGISLKADEENKLYKQISNNGEYKIAKEYFFDIRNKNELREAINEVKPDVIFHFSAQAYVRRSYAEPVDTWEINILGTLNVLENVRTMKRRCSIIIATTDKVYENNEKAIAFKENDRLGGIDPYSASKSAKEILARSYFESYFKNSKLVTLATVRAGNVIGGGDWGADRLVPDFLRAKLSGNTVSIRSPNSVRPWQHVIESIYGYIKVAEKIGKQDFCESYTTFNIGPSRDNVRTVKQLAELFCKKFGLEIKYDVPSSDMKESNILLLDSSKAETELGWKNRLTFDKTVDMTVEWYREVEIQKNEALTVCLSNINMYENYL